MPEQWTDREWKLAERFWVPCPNHCHGGIYEVNPESGEVFTCEEGERACPGRKYPLRRPCPRASHRTFQCRDGRAWHVYKGTFVKELGPCLGCGGHGYTPQCDYDSLCTAIRQRGDWSCRVFIAEDVNDDFVEIRVAPSWEILGLVDADDDPRLFGGAAIHEALLRALEKEVTDAKH